MNAVLARFDAATRAARGVVWGRFDCLQMALACAGRSEFAAALPQYSTELGALRGLRKIGCADLAELLDRAGREIPAASALPGDVAWRPQQGLAALGVAIGPAALFIAPVGGLAPLEFPRAWRL